MMHAARQNITWMIDLNEYWIGYDSLERLYAFLSRVVQINTVINGLRGHLRPLKAFQNR